MGSLPVGRLSSMICSSERLSRCLTTPRSEFPCAAIRIRFPDLASRPAQKLTGKIVCLFLIIESLWSYLLDLGNDDVVPVGEGALNGQLEGLVHGELLLARLVLVALILEANDTLAYWPIPTRDIFAF
jgi:hypothetical protein